MKMRFMLYNEIVQSEPEFLKPLKEIWGDRFPEYEQAMLRGIAKAFRLVENQIKIVLDREGVEGEIAFDVFTGIGGKDDKLGVLLSFSPKDAGGLWFELGGKGLEFGSPINKYFIKYKETNVAQVEETTYGYAKCLASDIAREGIPREMKQVIAEVARGLNHLTSIDEEFQNV